MANAVHIRLEDGLWSTVSTSGYAAHVRWNGLVHRAAAHPNGLLARYHQDLYVDVLCMPTLVRSKDVERAEGPITCLHCLNQ